MATYGTDLVVIATGSDGESGTWTEFTGWASGGTPGAETENFIQNTQSQSQSLGNAVTGKSICFDAGSDVSGSIPSGDVVMGWFFFGAGTNLYTYASGGHRFGIGASVANFDMWSVSGDDRQPNPYGGWFNVAVDPTVTPDYTAGTGSGGAWRYFGSLLGDTTLGIRVKVAKGNPHAVDGMLMGRGEIYCTGTGATFTLMAADNDAVANRWGLLQDTGGGTFLWKGLMSLGQSGTSTTFSASNQTIVIDDTAKVTSGFNKIEIRHASSSITWNNISFFARGTVSPGQFEMVENAATMAWTGCSFNNMDTFIFLSNAVLIGCIWNGCGVITHGGADFEGCSFAGYEGTADTALMDYNGTVDINGEIDNCAFTMGTALTHAISFTDNTTFEHTLTGCDFSGYGAENTNSSALYFPDSGSDIDWVINLSGCSGTINFKKVRAGDTVTLVADQITHTLSGLVNNSEVTYVKRGAAIDTGSDGSTTVGSRDFVTTNAWTVDAYKGFLLEITSGADVGRYYCSGNSATTLYLDAELTATASSLTWELYDENDDTEPFHVENVSGNQTDYTYAYTSDVEVDIMIHNQDYVTITLEKITLGNTSVDLPQVQVEDDNYFNP